MSRKSERLTTEALCIYDECHFCSNRVNATRTPAGEGQCNLELQGGAKRSICKGRLFLRLAPDRAPKYRAWVLGGKPALYPRSN